MFFLATAFAQEPPQPPAEETPEVTEAEVELESRDATFEHHGELRFVGSAYPDFAVDSDGTMVDQGPVLDSRLRMGGSMAMGGSTLDVELDLLDAQIAGDVWGLSPDDERRRADKGVMTPDAFTLRQAKVSGLMGPAMLTAGFTTSHWGLGMLSNDGAQDPTFGRNDLGDRVFRVSAATRLPLAPAPLVLFVAGDRVLADDLARFDEGQAAYQGTLAAVLGDRDATHAGVYTVYRSQRELDPRRRTQVGVLDVTGAHVMPVGPIDLRVAGEAAGVLGQTSRSLSYNAREQLLVRSAGATGVVAADADFFELQLRSGWASGDGDPYDEQTNDFGFDRNFDVGMVMFDEFQGGLENGAYLQLTDPHNTGKPPDGIEALLSEGAFKRATFVQPALTVHPKPWGSIRLGLTSAWQTAPIAQPFESHRAGGVPTNHLGQPTSEVWMGWEIDWAILLSGERDGMHPEFLLQGGHYFASEDLGSGRHDLVAGTARLRW
ncbi:MAG TPA: hypothetical protein QGF58_21915 [Myxococcota bacterium]|nr:hypothetical protein [Myxococcota bacterium]